ncbi:YopX family protein [Bacillus sp. JJ1503]|uniref:YopX family protein n=1 Tax=Bacillus sp. JJ1503 TaxID=3122956 RepID=UPI002FFE67A0
MRAYKFRAWDQVENRMRYENDVDSVKEWPSILAVGFHGLPISIDTDSFKDGEIIGWNRDHNLILMQSTGLHDKNGCEIYEGDTLNISDRHLPQIVTFDEGMFCTDEFSLFELTRNEYRSFEVVGNIYEKEATE